ncbi:hypothetical protein, partial [Kitasatospora nipponensis]|uniref:hypothetical protein n=1 Tax=Kitasatospora nipponensis TaxID=258049 RepID=UPI0031E40621
MREIVSEQSEIREKSESGGSAYRRAVMQGISEISRNLRAAATAGDSTPAGPALAELEDLSESILHRTDEHDLAMLLCLAGICSVRTGAGLPAGGLHRV